MSMALGPWAVAWLLAMALALPALGVGAELTMEDGVVVKFGPDAQLIVRDRLTPGQGIVFSGLKDDEIGGQVGAIPQTPHLGDWLGVRLEKSAAGFGVLVWSDLTIRYAGATGADGTASAALTIRGWSPTLSFPQLTDSAVGLRLLDGAAPSITGASFLRNLTGMDADGGASSIGGSQFVGNTLLAVSNRTPTTEIQAIGNWWGHASGPYEPVFNPQGQGDAISAGIDFSGFLTGPMLINPTVRLTEPTPYFEQAAILLDLACVNATEYRLAEGSNALADQAFQPLDQWRTRVTFTASAGDGRKPVNVEFRDANGATATASLSGGLVIDTQPPVVTLTNPADGSFIRQPITVEATAADALGISELRFYLNNQLAATRAVAPYTFTWNTDASTDGAYTIKAVATDGASRTGAASATVTLSHAPPPPDTDGPALSNVRVDGSPLADGATFVRSSALTLSASDRSGVARIELLLDGAVVGTASGNSNYSVAFNLDAVANGAHSLALRAADSLGNLTTLGYAITVTHAPPATPVLSQPANGLVTRTSSLTVAGTAPVGTYVRLWRNDQQVGSALNIGADGRFAATLELVAGANRIQATAADNYGTSPASAAVLVTLDTSVPASPGNLTATAQASGTIRLAWTRSTDPNVVGYEVYRAATAFNATSEAVKVNAGPLTTTSHDDLPLHDGSWTYRVVAINAANTPSLPSNAAQAVSDSTAPRAVAIVYTPHGKVDAATGNIGQGQVDVALTVSEALAVSPYLAIVPQGGKPIAIDLAADNDTRYSGHFLIDADIPSGLANALFSARDAVGNRGTDIDVGATLKIDTAGPALSGISLDPASPIRNDGGETVEATLTFSEAPHTTPDVSVQLSGVGRTPLPLTGLAPVDSITWRGKFTLPADAGQTGPETLAFHFEARDAMDNVSSKVLASNKFQVYQGDLPPLAVPNAFTAKAQPAGKVKLAWQAVDGAAGYQIYRKAPGDAGLEPLIRITGTEHLDQTPADGAYTYAVASIREANGQEALSGLSTPANVTASATAPGAPRNFALRLTGQGVVAEWQVPTSGNVASYNLYRATGTSLTSHAGLTPLKTGLTQTLALDATPSPTQGAYAVTALDAAGNESALSGSAYLNASLLPVSRLTIERVAGAAPVISWTAPNGTIAGYRVYADLPPDTTPLPLTAAPITALNLTDTGYTDGERHYTVATVDANGVEMPRSLLLPNLSAEIVAGLPLRRGLMNELQVQVANASASRLDNVRVIVRLPTDKNATQFQDHASQAFSLDAGQTRTVAVVVGGYTGLPDAATARLSVEVAPNEGEVARLVSEPPVEVVEGALVVGMATEEFTRGGIGKLRLTIENTSDVAVELLTATQNGQGDSTELRFKLLDADGNVLATQPYRQGVGANVVTLTNGQTVARIPAHASYVSDLFSLNVPASSPDTLRVRLEVDKLRYHTGQSDAVTITGRGSEKTVALRDTAYFGEVTSASPATSFGDQDIVISGRAVDRASQAPLPNAPLKLVLNQQGFERVFTVLSDETGSFAYTFKPQASDAGLFKVSAVHPDATDRPEQRSFTVERITVGPTPYRLDLPKNATFAVPFTAKAGPGTAATRLRFALSAASQPTGQIPAGVNLQLPAPVNLAERQTQNLPVTFTASPEAPTSGSLILDLLSDEQPAAPLGQARIDYTLSDAKPYLTSTPSYINTGLAQGGTQIESVAVKNQGLETAANLRFSLTRPDGSAAPAWAALATSANGDLAVGAERVIDLAFNPPASTAEGVYEFRLKVEGDNLPTQSLNVYVSLTQSGQGSVLFKASDIYTATADKNGQLIQGLAGASLTLQNEEVATVTRQATTDAFGEALFQNLPAGRYTFRAKASNHQELGGRLTVKPGITVQQAVFLDYNLITVDWSVREITIEDRYEITLNATFETDVPAAVIVLEPPSVNLPKLNTGEVFYGELSLTNYGLIRADHVRQQLPQSDAFFRFEFLSDVPSSLEAKQRVTLPYRVVALQSLEGAASSGAASGGGCYNYSSTTSITCDYVCANGTLIKVCGSSTSWFAVSNGSCPGGGGGGTSGTSGGNAWGSWPGGFGGPSGGITDALPGPQKCEKCKKKKCCPLRSKGGS